MKTLIEEYNELITKKPELDITRKYKISQFHEISNEPGTIFTGIYRQHPMGGYSGGRQYNIGASARVKYMSRKKVYRARCQEQDCGSSSKIEDFDNLADAVKFAVKYIPGILGYWGDEYERK